MTYNATPGHVVDSETYYFISNLLTITGDTRLLVVPTTTTGTTVADASKNAHNLTSNESVAGWVVHTGRGVNYDLDGAADLMYHADHADFTFGNGVADSAFSVFALINSDSSSGDNYIISKHDFGTSDFEWHLHLTNGNPWFQLHDDSAPGNIARYRNSAITDGTWYFIGGTYDGSAGVGGIKVYLDGVQVDDTSSTGGAYTAMEDTGAGLSVGAMLDTSPAGASFFNGKIAAVCICAKELAPCEMWALSKLVRGYFGV